MSLDYGCCPAVPRAFLCPCSPSLLPKCCHPGPLATEPPSRQHAKDKVCAAQVLGSPRANSFQYRVPATLSLHRPGPNHDCPLGRLYPTEALCWDIRSLRVPSKPLLVQTVVLGSGGQGSLKNDNGYKTALPLTMIREFSDILLALSLDQFTLKVDSHTGVCHCN